MSLIRHGILTILYLGVFLFLCETKLLTFDWKHFFPREIIDISFLCFPTGLNFLLSAYTSEWHIFSTKTIHDMLGPVTKSPFNLCTYLSIGLGGCCVGLFKIALGIGLIVNFFTHALCADLWRHLISTDIGGGIASGKGISEHIIWYPGVQFDARSDGFASFIITCL